MEDEPVSATARMIRAPKVVTGARRRSATGRKIHTAISSFTGGATDPVPDPADVACRNVPDSAITAATTQSIAIQGHGRIRLVSGGRGGRGVPCPASG